MFKPRYAYKRLDRPVHPNFI